MRLQGRREFPLTDRGRQQAEALAARLSGQRVEAIYTSPIQRAADTATAIAERAGVALAVEARLQEYDFGEALSGRTWQEIREMRPELMEALLSDKAGFPHYPGEEGRDRFRTRVKGALGEIAGRHRDDGSVVVVTHAGPIAVFLLDVLGLPYRRPIPFVVDNASVTTVEFVRDPLPGFPAAVVVGLNDTCHLRAD